MTKLERQAAGFPTSLDLFDKSVQEKSPKNVFGNWQRCCSWKILEEPALTISMQKELIRFSFYLQWSQLVTSRALLLFRRCGGNDHTATSTLSDMASKASFGSDLKSCSSSACFSSEDADNRYWLIIMFLNFAVLFLIYNLDFLIHTFLFLSL